MFNRLSVFLMDVCVNGQVIYWLCLGAIAAIVLFIFMGYRIRVMKRYINYLKNPSREDIIDMLRL